MSYEAPTQFTPQAQYCPRHPDRIAYVRCQRCGRPVCPECQVPAAVGVQCVDCVKQQHRASAGLRTALGAPISRGRPTVTIGLILACVFVYIVQQLDPSVTSKLAIVTVNTHAYPWTFLTSIFVHWSILHIALNMWALWSVGTYLEQMLGRARYLALFFLSGLGGSVLIVVWAMAEPTNALRTTFSAGASGAIFGLFGALLLISHKLHQNVAGIASVIGINLIATFMITGISWQAHIGGLVTGLALGAVYAYAPKTSRKQWAVVGSAAIAVVLVAVAYFVVSHGVDAGLIAH